MGKTERRVALRKAMFLAGALQNTPESFELTLDEMKGIYVLVCDEETRTKVRRYYVEVLMFEGTKPVKGLPK